MTQPTPEDLLAIYGQNSEHFRGLNSQMWQIPIIGMTLTGGLWFGVSNVKDSPIFQMGLLFLALVGNVALIVVLNRLRFVMKAYLDWIDHNLPSATINAVGPGLAGQPYVVRTTFQAVLGTAAVISLGLLGLTGYRWHEVATATTPTIATAYDAYAFMIADEYEVPTFDGAHPLLASELRQGSRLSILHLGTGAARDVPAIRELGHTVLAGQPSPHLLQVARASSATAEMFYAPIPALPGVGGSDRFDLIVINAAWAHVAPRLRQGLMDHLLTMLRPGGRLYLAFRDGPTDESRLIYPTSIAELRRLSGGSGAMVRELPQRADLAGRPDVKWRTVIVSKPYR